MTENVLTETGNPGGELDWGKTTEVLFGGTESEMAVGHPRRQSFLVNRYKDLELQKKMQSKQKELGVTGAEVKDMCQIS